MTSDLICYNLYVPTFSIFFLTRRRNLFICLIGFIKVLCEMYVIQPLQCIVLTIIAVLCTLNKKLNNNSNSDVDEH